MSPIAKSMSGRVSFASLAIWLTYIVLLAFFCIIYHPFFPLPGARIGDDYSLMFTGWLDGLIWFQKNGLEVPWFSPSFCAGQPFFPDPQSSFYSLPQLINLVAPPLKTAFATLLLSATLMFWGGYLLMRKVFSTGPLVAGLVGGLLMFNGFLPHRMLVGHVTFHGFALVPWIALLLLMGIRHRFNSVAAACAAGLMLAYWVHSGFGTLILAGGLAIIVIALVFGLTGRALAGFLMRGALAGAIGLGVAIAKLWATFSFLSYFPRTFYLLPGAASVSDAVPMIAGALLLPSQWAADLGMPRLTNIQWSLAPHEWAYNFGIVTGLLLLGLIVHRIGSKKWHWPATRRQALLWLILSLCLAWPLAFNVWDPTWNEFLKTVPVINSASTPLRWIIVYIPFIAVAIGLLLEKAKLGKIGHFLAAACLAGTVAQAAYEPRQFYRAQEYDARPITIADEMLRAERFNPGVRVLGTSAEVQVDNVRMHLRGNDTFIAGVSQIFCYNPVFGYRLEKFSAANLNAGPILAVHDGFLNLKNPACYVYPEENDCQPGDRFRADQLEQAKAFIDHRPFSFKLSEGQKWAGRLTQFSLAFIACILLIWLGLAVASSMRRRNSR